MTGVVQPVPSADLVIQNGTIVAEGGAFQADLIVDHAFVFEVVFSGRPVARRVAGEAGSTFSAGDVLASLQRRSMC